jgi:predicted permease
LKLFAMPAVAFLLAKLVFDLSPAEVYAVTVLAALPTAQNVFNYALRYDTAVILARDTVSVTTLGAAPLVFMLAALFGPV